MNSKKIVTIIVIVVLCIAGYKMVNSGGGIGLEKSLIATLPEEITSCYCRDNNGEKILNILEVEEFTIDRQTTDGNYKSADCTIEMEGENLKTTVYVNLQCVKYDDGSWQVNSWSQLSEPIAVPKFAPDETAAVERIKEDCGFQNLSKINEYIDLENREVAYYYTVQDKYEYVSFEGDGVSCCFTFDGSSKFDYEKNAEMYTYSWSFGTVENRTEMVWDVLGTWHLEWSFTGNPPYRTADITLNTLAEDNGGTSVFSYPNVYPGSSEYTGERTERSGTAGCTISGSCPLDAKCVIYGIKASVTITCQGVEGYVDHLGDDACQTVIRR